MAGGGLLISAARLVEFNCRAAILIAPGLFRFDLTPLQETLGLAAAPRSATHGLALAGPRSRRGTGTATPASREAPLGAAPAGRPAGRPAARLGGTSSPSRTATRAPCTSSPRPRSERPPGGRASPPNHAPPPPPGALLRWYERVRRPLPWRATRDPYALLVSEVMLQQTQAARVVPYYQRVPGALLRSGRAGRGAGAPTCSPPGAGSATTGGRWPCSAAAAAVAARGWPEDLSELPGVGAYTAAAVGSFAWDAQAAAVDANVRRVIGRHDGAAHAPGALAARALELMPAGRGGAVQPGDDGARCHGLPPAAAGVRRLPGARGAARRGAASRAATPRRVGRSERFEDTDRWARGRIVAALVAGEAPPALAPARRARAEAGLLRDGLAVRAPTGELRLP